MDMQILEQEMREWLEGAVRPGVESTAEELVLANGTVFKSAKRPTNFRRRAAKQCFLNSSILASEERGLYCEGFAMAEDVPPFHHAWITVGDGVAIDVTLPDPKKYFYFGIQLTYKAFVSLFNKDYGEYGFLRPPFDKELLLSSIENH